MEVLIGAVILVTLIVGLAYFKLSSKQETLPATENEVCKKCIDNVQEVVKKIIEYKKGVISGEEFANSVKDFSSQVERLVEEAREKNLPDNVVYALKDAGERLKSLSLEGEEWKDELEKIGNIIKEVEGKLDKVECKPSVISNEVIEKALLLNRILAGIDVAVITASLVDKELKEVAKELDRATILSKEIAEALKK